VVAVGLGFLAGLGYAWFKRTTGWVVREYYDIAILWPLLPLMALYLAALWIRRPRPTDKGRMGAPQGGASPWRSFWEKALAFIPPVIVFFLMARCLPDLFIAPLDFDVGLGTVFNMEWLLRATGWLCGLLILSLLWLATAIITRRLGHTAALLTVTACLLWIFCYLGADALRIMYVRRLWLTYGWVADLVIFLSGRENFFLFLEEATLALAALFLLWVSVSAKPGGDNPALVRKARYGLALDRRSAIFLLVCLSMVFLCAQNLRAVHERGPNIPDPDEVFAQDGAIRLPLEIVGDGNLHRYAYKTESGTIVRFIVIKKSANAYGVGLDACDICGATGYYQRGDQVICKLCDVVMNKTTIGFPGGCNPVPLQFKIESGAMLIDPSHLDAERRRFE
jgi:uncharacterized membrane protein